MEFSGKTDIVIIGGGSAGVAAAYRAASSGAQTILVEPEPLLGGTSVNSWVCCWEPVIDSNGFPKLLYRRMREIPDGCGIYTITRHCGFMAGEKSVYPGGEQRIHPQLTYGDTQKKGWKYGEFRPELWNGVIFEPAVFDQAVREMLGEVNCSIRRAACTGIEQSGDLIQAVRLSDGGRIEADYVIDNSGIAARLAGCEVLSGADAGSLFQEPDAPEHSDPNVCNGISLIFRLSRGGDESARGSNAPCRWAGNYPVMVATEFPNGDWQCNMLPTMTGMEYRRLGPEAADAECRRRVTEYFDFLRWNYPEFRQYRIAGMAPRPGVRESFRVRCVYQLREQDLLRGRSGGDFPDSVVYADHAMDLHGVTPIPKITLPYGIPYRCLRPVGIRNLLVAGRIAGFSSLAASSCRLARTMMRLGEAAGYAAAGYAAALAWGNHCGLDEISRNELQRRMRDECSTDSK